MQILSDQNLVKILDQHIHWSYLTIHWSYLTAIILFILTFSILLILNIQFHKDLKILSLTYFIPLLGFFIVKTIQSLRLCKF